MLSRLQIFINGDFPYSCGHGCVQIQRKKSPFSEISGYVWIGSDLKIYTN